MNSVAQEVRKNPLENSRRVARYATLPFEPHSETVTSYTVPASVPLWYSTIGSYTYSMIGQSPYTALSNPTTTISAPVIPLILTFSDGTVFDPTQTSTCSTAGAPSSLMLSSPIFNNSTYKLNGSNTVTTLYHDFYQRANFWQYTNPSGVNPNYHLLFTSSVGTPVSISVPSASGSTTTESCGRMGGVDINFLNNYLLTTGFAQLASNGVLPSQMPVFVLSNVVMYENTTADCCILGYHSAFSNSNYSGATQLFAVVDFDTTKAFGNTTDVAAASHEIGESIDDPLGNNPTPPWGNIGQVSGCQSNLEVGDPLSGTDVTITMSNNFTYHVQELAFFSWFYRQSTSIGLNGWYSSNGTFTTPSAPCNPTTTTLTINPSAFAFGAAVSVGSTVAPASGSGTPTGTVTLVSGTGATLATYTLSSGTVSTTTASLPAGSYTVTANYSGDSNYNASSSAAVSVTVGSPSVSFSPTALTFSSQTVGNSSASQSVTLSNSGTASLTIGSLSLSGASPGDYSKSSTCGSSLAVGGKCTISVTFKPTASGTRTATLSLADNASGSPQTVALSGTGITTQAPISPTVTLSSSALTFASTTVGIATASQSVTLTNTGSSSVTISSITLGGTNSGDFSKSTTCLSSLAAKGACTISVTFTPSATGTRAATLSIVDSGSASTQTVSLSGTGVAAAPAVSLSATSLSFGSSKVTVATASQVVTLTNSGTAALAVSTVTLGGTNSGDFSESTTCAGATIAVKGTCTITVTFKPTAIGSRAATISIADNASGSTQSIALSGTGVSPVTLSASSIAFGLVSSGTKSSATLTVTNSGTSSLTFSSIALSGSTADFSQSNNCSTGLAAGKYCTVTLTFAPASKIAYTATLTLTDSAAGSPQTVSLSGTGK